MKGRIAYIQLGGKILYRESDIERMLLTATAPPIDRRHIWFSWRSAVCRLPVIATAMNFRQRKERLTDEASKFSFVCKPFLFFFWFPVSRLFPLPDAFKRVAGGKVFGLNTLKLVWEDSARNGSAARPCCHVKTIRYLCIRASGTGGWRNEPQLYHRFIILCHKEETMLSGFPFLVAQILFITNRLNKGSFFAAYSEMQWL